MTKTLSEARAVVMNAVANLCAESNVKLARTQDIVERVGKKRVTVTIMLTRLKKEGLVENPLGWGSWQLTEDGQKQLELYKVVTHEDSR